MSESKRRFKVVFTIAYVKKREAGYPKLLQSERKGVLQGNAKQNLGYDFSLNFV